MFLQKKYPKGDSPYQEECLGITLKRGPSVSSLFTALGARKEDPDAAWLSPAQVKMLSVFLSQH